MQLASVSVLGHGTGRLGNTNEFIREVLNKFKDQYDREQRAFIQANERQVQMLERELEERYGTLSKYPEIRERQLKRYKEYMSQDLRNQQAWGMIPTNL